MTENISRSGLLMRVDEPLQLDIPLRIVVELPVVPGEQPAHLICRGRVVRAIARTETGAGSVVAATIAHCRFRRVKPSAVDSLERPLSSG
jgi:hypothetical protein